MQERVDRIGCAFGQRDSSWIIQVARFNRDIVTDFDRSFQRNGIGFEFLIDDVGCQNLSHAGWHTSYITVVGIEFFSRVAIHHESALCRKIQSVRIWHTAAKAQDNREEHRKYFSVHHKTPLVNVHKSALC